MGDYGNSFTFVSSGTLGGGSDLNHYNDWSGSGTGLLSAEQYRMCIYAPRKGEKEVTVYDSTSVWGKLKFSHCYDASDSIIFSAKKNENDSTNTFVGSSVNWASTGTETAYSYSVLIGDWSKGDITNVIGQNKLTFNSSNVEYRDGLPFLRFGLNSSWFNFYFSLYTARSLPVPSQSSRGLPPDLRSDPQSFAVRW